MRTLNSFVSFPPKRLIRVATLVIVLLSFLPIIFSKLRDVLQAAASTWHHLMG